jgi:hypothetical protein
MIVNTPGNHDWATVLFTHVSDLFSSQSTDSFALGQKQDARCPDISGHSNPPKDGFTDVASYSETNVNALRPQFNHTFLYGATVRFAPNGNASENVELKQDTNGNCATACLARTVGDKLVAIDYLNGGTSVDVHVLTWIDGTDQSNPTCFVGNDAPRAGARSCSTPLQRKGRQARAPSPRPTTRLVTPPSKRGSSRSLASTCRRRTST